MINMTRITNNSGNLSKTFGLDGGKLTKTAAADLVSGTAERVSITELHDLTGVIAKLTPAQALTYGISAHETAMVTTQKRLAATRSRLPVIARDGKHFAWPQGRGVLMLDIDAPKDGSKPLKSKQVDAILCKSLPWWKNAARFYRPSVSAFISDANGKQLSASGSLRCYAIVDNAANIPFVGLAIMDALWNAGHGRVEFSKAGSALLRCPVDAAVWQPERLDFAGPAILNDGLTQTTYPPLFFYGGDIDSEAAIAAGPGKISQTEWKARNSAVQRALAKAKPEETRRRVEYVRAKSADEVEARRRLHALYNGALDPSDRIHFADGVSATVADILKDCRSFDGKRCADPEDPEYAGDRRIARLYANGGWPRIFSHAHGGTVYKLGRAVA